MCYHQSTMVRCYDWFVAAVPAVSGADPGGGGGGGGGVVGLQPP